MQTHFKFSAIAAALAAIALLGSESAVAAPLNLTTGDKITLGYGNGANGDTWGGGEFLASGVAGQVAKGAGDAFFTFCLEYSEHFSPGSQYFVRINTEAVNGGLSSAGTYAGDAGATSTGDPISKATAWLYTQFIRNPTSLGYDMSGGKNQANTVNQARNDSFQLAIWQLEGELSASASGSAFNAYGLNTVAQNWVTTAISASASWADNGDVRVMNLYSDAAMLTNHKQDQLYMAVPEPASLALLGIALVGLGNLRRRKAG